MSACDPKSHELSHAASALCDSYAPFVVRCLAQFSSRLCIGTDEAGLRKFYTGQHPVVPATSSPGGHECSGSTGLPVKPIQPHHTAAPPSALASSAGVNYIQAGLPSVPVHPWTGADLPG